MSDAKKEAWERKRDEIKAWLIGLQGFQVLTVHEWKNMVDHLQFRDSKIRVAVLKEAEEQITCQRNTIHSEEYWRMAGRETKRTVGILKYLRGKK